jgi:lambda family phage portal protein
MNLVTRSIAVATNILTFGALNEEMERAYYEGAKSTRLNRDFNVSNNHFELQSGADRNMLKARARWLAANNPITKSIDKSIIKNTVGTGITLQSKIKEEDYKKSKELNKNIEAKWNEFIKKENFDITGRVGLYRFQALVLKTKMTDGEVLINKVHTKDKKFPLKFQLVESDQFDEMKTKNNKNDVYTGVEVDSLGKPVAYHLKTSINSMSSQRFLAENIIHYYDLERATQYRGISDYAQVINNLKDFAAFNDSVIVKNRILSSLAVFIKTGDISKSLYGDKKEGKRQGSSEPIKQITSGMIKYLNKGEEIQTVQSTQQGNEYNDFVSNTIRVIAAGRDISYELAFKDYTKTNFSSARASLIQDNKRFDMEQNGLKDDVLTPIFADFIDSQVLSGNLQMPNDYWTNKEKYLKPVWGTPRREWVDPLKDIKTIEKEIDLDMSTRTKSAKLRGHDYEDIIDEKIAEEVMIKEKREKAGLSVINEEEK